MSRAPADVLLHKTLSANDVGQTGTHQAGVLVPKSVVDYFPDLDDAVVNPDAELEVSDPGGTEWRWRYVYYNGGLHGTSSRDEYRLTHTAEFLRKNRAKAGDILELRRISSSRYEARLLRPAPAAPGPTPGRWTRVQLSWED